MVASLYFLKDAALFSPGAAFMEWLSWGLLFAMGVCASLAWSAAQFLDKEHPSGDS